QYGAGPSDAPFKIFMGAEDGLYLVSPDGKEKELLVAASAEGVENFEWSPSIKKEKLLVYFAHPVTASGGTIMKGLYLIHLDRKAQGLKGLQLFEQIHERTDVHTVVFSPHGHYVTWVTWEGVYFRDVEGKAADVTKVEIKDAKDG